MATSADIEELIEKHLQQLTRLGCRPGLERITRLLALMGNPHQELRCVHIAGTNGKGSTSLIISDVLTRAGYQVGRFNSPHLHSYLERLTINGKQIEAAIFKAYLDDIELKLPEMLEEGYSHPTEFEVLTALAFQYFKDAGVDIAVLEVGLGGIYDSTNVIVPVISVITSVSFDHMNILGYTLEEIAHNKAGIIKNQVPVVTGEMDEPALRVIRDEARQQKARWHPSTEVEITSLGRPDIHGQLVDIRSTSFNLKQVDFSLPGDYQLKNLATSLTALAVLKQQGWRLDEENIEAVLSNLKMPGRLEIIKETPPVIIDVAHNPQAAAALKEALDNLYPGRKRVMVCGLVDDKDAAPIIAHWGENTRVCMVTRPEGPRGNNWRRVTREWEKAFPDTIVYEEENIPQAVQKGMKVLQNGEYLLITGSFYVLNQARRCLGLVAK